MNDPIMDMDITKSIPNLNPAEMLNYCFDDARGTYSAPWFNDEYIRAALMSAYNSSSNMGLGCMEPAKINDWQRVDLAKLGIDNPERYKFRK